MMEQLPGWHLLGAFPDLEPDDVGAWLLHNEGEALLLELPPGLTVKEIAAGLRTVGAGLRYVAASHLHEDHFDKRLWKELQEVYVGTHFIHPSDVNSHTEISVNIGGEPAWLIKAPKHSYEDIVTVFRGVAMTGDIELGTLDSVNDEVSSDVKAASMQFLQSFEERTGYYVHTIVSAHLNDFRQRVNWRELFAVA